MSAPCSLFIQSLKAPQKRIMPNRFLRSAGLPEGAAARLPQRLVSRNNNSSSTAHGPQQPWQERQQHLVVGNLPYVPSSVHCPIELNPITNSLGEFVPFANALRSVRSRCLPTDIGNRFDADDEFEWLDQANNSSCESSSRKLATKEAAKRESDSYFFLYFRIRMENYVALVTALKQSCKDESIFNEENLDRWTHKYKFKIRRLSPLKKVLLAFSSRMGVEGDPDVIYCIDGFYGDAFTGRMYHRLEVPNNRVLPSNTCVLSGLNNGSSIFVSRINDAERQDAVAQLQLDLMRGNELSEDEEGETQASAATRTTGEQTDNKKVDTQN